MANKIFFLSRFFSKVVRSLRLKYYFLSGINIGEKTYISPKAYIDTHRPGSVTIGKNCYITRNVVILCHTDTRKGGPLGVWQKRGGKREYGDVLIGNNVFVGVNSVILPGIKIGNDVIIGALTLVDKDIPDGVVVAGVPARIIGKTIDHLAAEKLSYKALRYKSPLPENTIKKKKKR